MILRRDFLMMTTAGGALVRLALQRSRDNARFAKAATAITGISEMASIDCIGRGDMTVEGLRLSPANYRRGSDRHRRLHKYDANPADRTDSGQFVIVELSPKT